MKTFQSKRCCLDWHRTRPPLRCSVGAQHDADRLTEICSRQRRVESRLAAAAEIWRWADGTIRRGTQRGHAQRKPGQSRRTANLNRLERRGVESIRAFIAQDSRSYADLEARRIVAAVDRLRTFPESGRPVPERQDPAVREIITSPYRIVYRLRSGVHDQERGRIEKLSQALERVRLIVVRGECPITATKNALRATRAPIAR
jgi:plasmid stabilization system protein ParE